MLKYKIETRQSIYKTYIVEANSPDDAKAKYRDANVLLSEWTDNEKVLFSYEDDGLRYEDRNNTSRRQINAQVRS